MFLNQKDHKMLSSSSTRLAVPYMILLILAISLIQCDGRGTAFVEYVYTIRGTVTDSITGEPLDSAQVYYLYLDSTYIPVITDTLGQFRYEHMYSMPSPLTCTKEGYITKEIVIQRMKYLYRYDNIDFQLVPVP